MSALAIGLAAAAGWILCALVVVGLCRAAARGDALDAERRTPDVAHDAPRFQRTAPPRPARAPIGSRRARG